MEENNSKNEEKQVVEEESSTVSEETNGKERGVVIAEFCLANVDSLESISHCEIFSNTSSFVIGRAPHCDYRVSYKDKYVADEQASIVYSIQEEKFVIRCLAKDNPIFINKQREQADCYLHSGDIIKLGIAANAPQIRFTVEGEEQSREVTNISEVLVQLERGTTYEIGHPSKCHIGIENTAVIGVIARLTVPLQGEHLLLEKDEATKTRVILNGSEVYVNESRMLGYQQTLEIGSFFALLHNHRDFITPRTPEKHLFSDFVQSPSRQDTYFIGSDKSNTIYLDDPKVESIVTEIEVPAEGEYFLVRKKNSSLKITIDNEPVAETYPGTPYGVNQLLKVGDYLEIRNNHRSLPPPVSAQTWKRIVQGTLVSLLLAFLVLGVILVAQKYWPSWQKLLSSQKWSRQYQKNLVYITVYDETYKEVNSGMGFLLFQKDAQEKDIPYVVTCKDITSPWKFAKYRQNGEKIFDNMGKEHKYFIALWTYNSFTGKDKSYDFAKSFNNLPKKASLGKIEIIEPEDIADKEGDFFIHRRGTNANLAMLRLSPNKKHPFNYQRWLIKGKKSTPNESVIFYNWKKNKTPTAHEGKLTIDKDLLKIKTKASNIIHGGPVVNLQGNIIGILTYSPHPGKYLHVIPGEVLTEFIK